MGLFQGLMECNTRTKKLITSSSYSNTDYTTVARQTTNIAELIDALGDVLQATLYRHINLLMEGSFIEVIDTKKVKGTEERVFSVKKEKFQDPENEIESTSQEDHIRDFSVFHGNFLQLATTYLAKAPPQTI